MEREPQHSIKLIDLKFRIAKVDSKSGNRVISFSFESSQPSVNRGMVFQLDSNNRVVRGAGQAGEGKIEDYYSFAAVLADFIDGLFDEAGENFLEMALANIKEGELTGGYSS